MADYTTLANVKRKLKILTTAAADDTVLSALITAASAYIDGQMPYDVISSSGTKKFDVPEDGDRELDLSPFVASAITSVTDASGATIPTSEWYTTPPNMTPISGIKIKATSTYNWLGTGSDPEQSISVVANWGLAATCPADIGEACEMLVISLYRGRYGTSVEGSATITAAGVVITPRDIPAGVGELLRRYKRIM